MDTFTEIYKRLSVVPGLCDTIGMEKSIAFIRMAAKLKEAIIIAQPPNHNPDAPPDTLPDNIASFLSSASGICPQFVHGCWEAFGSLIWVYEGDERIVKALKQTGLDGSLSGRLLFPPKQVCDAPDCTNRKVLRSKSEPSSVVLYTLADGACATFAHCLTCEDALLPKLLCQQWHTDILSRTPLRNPGRRTPIRPSDALNLFINLMLILWTSATNGAKIYDTALSKPDEIPRNHPEWVDTSFKLRTEHVWDGFTILSLLEDYERRGETLRVPHTGEQKDRFTAAMSDRNARIQFLGQPEWAHYCSKCIRVWDEGDGKFCALMLSSSDGITIGHPCCGVLHCPNPLKKHHDRFCEQHAYRANFCCVEGCSAPSDHQHGYLTCSDPNHRELETKRKKRDKAMFQLRLRVARAGVANPEDAFAAEMTAEDVEEMEIPDSSCPATKNPNGNRCIRALFGRRKTHNEQIIVRPCGVIVARATFFGSETVPQTVDMLKKVFHPQGSMPDIVIYDNNCTLYKHLAAKNDDLILTVGFPVDVFHWECKHKKDGIECSYHCSPLFFPELKGADGKAWFFNSSIAEQTNVWLGGYHSILREMGCVKFNFFLDEMILRKNKLTVAKLEADGACPGLRPFTT
ncbi:hypothetical protein MKEN_01166400 [Mycena kentingensis (nom. inval.)]|nr:hypothetical protein MKEN_01166400 [Mycena kentingensis (nom. inval.)]